MFIVVWIDVLWLYIIYGERGSVDGYKLVVQGDVHGVGGQYGLYVLGEHESAGLEGLLVGGEDARWVGVVADGECCLAVGYEARPCPSGSGGVGVVAHDGGLDGYAAVLSAAVVGELAVVAYGLLGGAYELAVGVVERGGLGGEGGRDGLCVEHEHEFAVGLVGLLACLTELGGGLLSALVVAVGGELLDVVVDVLELLDAVVDAELRGGLLQCGGLHLLLQPLGGGHGLRLDASVGVDGVLLQDGLHELCCGLSVGEDGEDGEGVDGLAYLAEEGIALSVALGALACEVAALCDDVGLVLAGLCHDVGGHECVHVVGEDLGGRCVGGPACFLDALGDVAGETDVQVVLQWLQVDAWNLWDV